jgi:hypothetical protein
VVALGVDGNNQLQVGFYTLNQTNLADEETLLLTQQTQHVRIEVSFDIVEEESAGNSSLAMSQTDPWLWRVCSCEHHGIVFGVACAVGC